MGRENMTKNFTSSAMRSKDYAEESNTSEEYLYNTKNLTQCSEHLLLLQLLSIIYVNRT